MLLFNSQCLCESKFVIDILTTSTSPNETFKTYIFLMTIQYFIVWSHKNTYKLKQIIE